MPLKQVRLGSQIVHGVDRVGQWVVTDLTGWHDQPATRRDGGERPRAHGDYAAERFYGPRMITVDGLLHFGDRDRRGYAVQAMEVLTAVAGVDLVDFVVSDAGVTRLARVKSLGIDYVAKTPAAVTFQLRLKADDPRRFGEFRQVTAPSGEGVTVFQRGTFPAAPVVRVTGSMPDGYALALGGRTVNVTRSLTSGNHEIDMRTGILRANGSVVRGGLGSVNLLRVDPGANRTFRLTPVSGSGSARLSFHDTYI